MTQQELETLARDVADLARHRERVTFQVKHPHYVPPPRETWPGAGPAAAPDDVLAIVHAEARLAQRDEGQQYDRAAVWASMGIHMGMLLAVIRGGIPRPR